MSRASGLSPKRVEALIWVLIYSGLLALGLGLAVRQRSPALGAGIAAAGCLLALAGIALIWVRSRMRPTPPSTSKADR